MRFFLILSFIFFAVLSENVVAQANIDKYKKIVEKNLRNASTDELVWVRAFNNTYDKYCKSHQTYEIFKYFYEVASSTIVDELIDRNEFTASWQGKYGFRKGYLKGFRKRVGTDGLCQCIYNHIIAGDSSCLPQ